MRKAALSVIVLALVLTADDKALACSCFYSRPSEGFDRAQAVFTGRIIKAEKSEWVVAVERVWKGEMAERVTLRDAHAGTSCAAGYKKGARYLFLVDVVKSERGAVYSPQVCNWGTRLRAGRIEVGENTYAWVEDVVLKDRGEGKLPIKNER